MYEPSGYEIISAAQIRDRSREIRKARRKGQTERAWMLRKKLMLRVERQARWERSVASLK